MAKATAVKKSESFDLDEVFAGAKKKEEPQKKSSVPLLQVDKNVQEKVTKILQLSGDIETKQTQLAILDKEVFAVAEPKRSALCAHSYVSSVKVPSSDGRSVTYVWMDKYKVIPVEREEQIKAVVGAKEYPQYFDKTLTIQVSKDISEDDLRELVKRVGGKEEFQRFFTVERTLKPTKLYTQHFFSFAEKVRAKLVLLVEQYKASLKVK